jgi:IclR family acetate operon transcriptional repressor
MPVGNQRLRIVTSRQGGVSARSARRYVVTALERGLIILQALALSDHPLTLQDVASRTTIPKATVFRLLATLEGRGFVARTRDGAYRLGWQTLQLTQPAHGTVDLRRAAQQILEHLHHLSGDTVNLAKWHDRQVIYVEVLPSSRPLRFVELPGSVAPLHATALGKAIAAFLPRSQVITVLREKGMPGFTPHTITQLSRFMAELSRVRAHGYAIDRQEKDPGAACIAAPVFDARGVVGAISLSAPASHMDARRATELAPHLLEACASLSRYLGHGQVARIGPVRPADQPQRPAPGQTSRHGPLR